MLDMTGDAGADLGVKRGGLPLQHVLVIRVTDDAVLRLDSFAGAVTRGAVIIEKRMRLREFAGTDGALDDVLRALEMEDGERRHSKG